MVGEADGLTTECEGLGAVAEDESTHADKEQQPARAIAGTTMRGAAFTQAG